MAITVLEGRTFAMLKHDIKGRVADITLDPEAKQVTVALNEGWSNSKATKGTFDNWEAARNWVRKAVQS